MAEFWWTCNYMLLQLANAKHCGASLRKCHPLQYTPCVRGFLLSVVESECEAIVISEVGAITAEVLVARIQSDQRREPERLECHSDRVHCVCARAGWVCLQTAPILIDYVHTQIYVYI